MAKKEESVEPRVLPSPRLLPWHSAAIAQLRGAWKADRLPHADLELGSGRDGLCDESCDSTNGSETASGDQATERLRQLRLHS